MNKAQKPRHFPDIVRTELQGISLESTACSPTCEHAGKMLSIFCSLSDHRSFIVIDPLVFIFVNTGYLNCFHFYTQVE